MAMVNTTGKHRPKRRHHGEGTVILRRDRWRAKPWAAVVPYVDASGRRRETWLSASSRAEADELRRDALRRLARTVPTEHTVGSYVRGYLLTAELGAATFDRYRHHLEQRIVPSLGNVPVADLTPPDVRLAMQSWSGSAPTRHGTLILLRAAMRQALTDRMVANDPTAGIRAPSIKARQPTVLDVDDARRLVASVEGERFAPWLIVSLGLGLRRGELLGLTTPDVDLAAGSVTIRHSLRRVPVSTRGEGDEWWRLQSPKADSGRTLPLPGFVADALIARLEARDAERKAARLWAANDLVFGDLHGNPTPFANLDRWFKGALRKAGLADMRWHELRASSATILLAEGVPELTVMTILGHRSLEMTRRYVRTLPRMSREAADRLQKVMG